jgi:hypothetical protein
MVSRTVRAGHAQCTLVAMRAEPTNYTHYERKIRLLNSLGQTRTVLDCRLLAARHMKHVAEWRWYFEYMRQLISVSQSHTLFSCLWR